MVLFVKIVNSEIPLTLSAKTSILDVYLGSDESYHFGLADESYQSSY